MMFDQKLANEPKLSKPMSSSMHPLRKQRSITNSGGICLVNSIVKRAISDVGPMDTCLIVPKKM